MRQEQRIAHRFATDLVGDKRGCAERCGVYGRMGLIQNLH
jgi:hypothetical protein